ncbi:class I SAM-dependent methyltransferase [Halopiger djelfimassiliensis]|uniref:class I SAM-dependent methyltransferase n=1 Tax=Halopiger djelfimassiliensis TaxID=1293047 RepID=UPI0006779457|nr:class I SAM-dependent methyltransferase [Halopiger djelfimassiliensis]
MPTEPLPFVEDVAAFLETHDHETVLEAAVGEGRNSQRLVREVADLHGCDVSADALETCGKRCNGRIETREDDVRALSYETGAFDATVLFDALTHMRSVELVLRELTRVTRPEGHLVFNVPTDDDEATESATLTNDYGLFREYEYDVDGHEVVYIVLTDLDAFSSLLSSFGLAVRDIQRYTWTDPPHPPYRLRRHEHKNLLFYTQRID